MPQSFLCFLVQLFRVRSKILHLVFQIDWPKQTYMSAVLNDGILLLYRPLLHLLEVFIKSIAVIRCTKNELYHLREKIIYLYYNFLQVMIF